MQNHYFNMSDPKHPYTHSLMATDGTAAPINALRGDAPQITDGFWPCEENGSWVQLENHKGEKGYVNGQQYTIVDYGPYPDGWSATAPIPTPTEEELFTQLRAMRNARLVATDKYLLADYPISPEELVTIKAYRQALRDLPEQEGAPWDGGGELTPWPEVPAVAAE